MSTVGTTNVFSFRAECFRDVFTLRNHLFFNKKLKVIKTTMELDEEGLPDVHVQMEGEFSMKDLKDILVIMPNSHVIYQTLRPIPMAENNMVRDTNRGPDWLKA